MTIDGALDHALIISGERLSAIFTLSGALEAFAVSVVGMNFTRERVPNQLEALLLLDLLAVLAEEFNDQPLPPEHPDLFTVIRRLGYLTFDHISEVVDAIEKNFTLTPRSI